MERGERMKQPSTSSATDIDKTSHIIGNSESTHKLRESIRRIQKKDMTVLITGETGTGKDLIARIIHFGSARASQPFIPVNCVAIPSDLAESTLFGHIRGAFTGATSDRKGYFELADGGTLFLDEIGDMPAELQAKLLRVLEDGVVRPIGAQHEVAVDVRVLAASNTPLETRVAAGAFRKDLYFRLAQFPIIVPPLREHPEDIPLLTGHFLEELAAEMGIDSPPALNREALAALTSHPFPGNVRELRNVLARTLIESDGQDIEPKHLHFVDIPISPFIPPPVPHSKTTETEAGHSPTLLDKMQQERNDIIRALTQHRGNISATAKVLGMSRQAVYRRMKKYGIRRQKPK
jgi:transcriptional regulator with GAF, ATPase, and Fis domain